jgi:hypothetical protein
MLDISLQNFESRPDHRLDRAAGAARHLGTVVRAVQGARPGAREARDLTTPAASSSPSSNSDEQPEIAGQLSQMFGVRSIPFCVLFKGGPAGRRLRRRAA